MSSSSKPTAIPLEALSSQDSSQTSGSLPFPAQDDQPQPIQDSESSSSKLTSSDKLSALPLPSSSSVYRLRGPSTRRRHRSLQDASSSLPSIQSSPDMVILRSLECPFDSDRGSLPAALQGIRQAISGRHISQSDPVVGSVRAGNRVAGSRKAEGHQTPHSRSSSPSRAASPFRGLFGWNLHRTHSRDEPFVPVNPWQSHLKWFASPSSTPQRRPLDLDFDCHDTFTTCLPFPIQCNDSQSRFRMWISNIGVFLTDTLPRQVYLYMLLRLPALYFSRVSRIFEDAEISKHEIQRMIQICAPATNPNTNNRTPGFATPPANVGMSANGIRRMDTILPPYPEDWVPPAVSPALARFKHSWEQFVDSLLREWKTLNLVSALLCTGILTMFQVPDAAGDPFTRWPAIYSLICALMSLTYGCVYIVQFGTMRSMYKASRWAEEAQRTKTVIWWNVWVLLATPAIWLAWSMIAFWVAIMSYVWRAGAEGDPVDGLRPPLTPHVAIAIRVLASVLLGLGLLYFMLIMRTFGAYSTREAGRRAGLGIKSGGFSAFGDMAAGREARNATEQERETPFRGRPRADDRLRTTTGDIKESPVPLGLGLSFEPSSGPRLGALREMGGDNSSSEKDRQRISPKL
ncbi:hypothetical protein QCA50_001121 [Cerrena zonata]|uniref:Uncharacterized protein n=1 Tax=Cerrena zonata TaxID=2478898 RepID=A0AAW0GW81_9APHY